MTRSKRPENDDLFENGLDPYKRWIYCDGPIDRELAIRVIKGLSVLDRLSHDPITLILNSEGGDMGQGFAIIDAIRLCSSDIIGTVLGEACSAAFVILQACDERVASANSQLMTHRGNREGNFDLKIDQRADRIVEERMSAVYGKRASYRLNKKQEMDWNMFPSEALREGLLDRIVGE